MKRFVCVTLSLVLLLFMLSGCFLRSADGIRDVRIYADTPAWSLAQAVNSQNTRKIARIAKNTPEILNCQDPEYGATLLFWAVGMEKYKSAEALLKAGADPDIISTYYGATALYIAASYSFVDSQAKKDPKYVKLLLEYGADPDIGFAGMPDRKTIYDIGSTPLMQSIGCGIEKTKALVEAGADINAKTENSQRTAAVEALSWGGMNLLPEFKKYAYYLIVEKKADITQPYYRTINLPADNPEDQFFPVDLLRDWNCKVGTEEYEWKIAIIEEFARQGVEYRYK